MSTVSRSGWLQLSYTIALIVHSILVVGSIYTAFLSAGLYGKGANSARDGLGLSLMFILTGMLAALPSVLALLSWWLCRRNGWQPSTGHKFLTIAIAGGFVIFILITVLT